MQGLRWLLIGILLVLLTDLTIAQDAVVQDIINRVNQERNRSGIPALLINSALTQAAQRHSDDMAATENLSHTGSDGSQFWQRMQDAGYLLITGAENILVQFSLDAGEAFSQWNSSPPHRANMLNPAYLEIGVAYAQATSGAYYMTMVLGARNDVTPPPVPEIIPTTTPSSTPTGTNTPLPTATPPPTFTPFAQPGDITRTMVAATEAVRVTPTPLPPTVTPTASLTPIPLRTLTGETPNIPTPIAMPPITTSAGLNVAQIIQQSFDNFSAGLQQGEVLASITPTVTPTPFPTATPSLPPDIRLFYDDDVFTLINVSGRLLDLSALNFESATGIFEAERWNNPYISRPLNAFTPDDCLQIWGVDTYILPEAPNNCSTRHAWAAVGDESDFWRDTDIFIVKQGDAAVGVCSTAAGQCDISFSIVITPPTLAAPTSIPEDIDIRLIYDALQLTLVNVSGRPLDLGRLIFTSPSGTISIERWNSKSITRSIYSYPSGDCLQAFVYGYDVLQPYTPECNIRHSWFVAGDGEDFWRDTTTFAVNRDGIRVAVCSVAQGQCDISLSANLGAAIATPVPNATPTPSGVDVRLIISPDNVTLLNISGRDLDLRNLIFVSDNASFSAIKWASQPLSRPLSQFTSGDCLQVWGLGGDYQEPPADCFVRHGWIVVPENEQFWANTSSFRVETFGNVLATCQVSAGICEFNLLPEWG